MAKAKESNSGIRNGKLFCFNCGQSYDIGSTPQPINMLLAIMKEFEKSHKKCKKTWEEPIPKPQEESSLMSISVNANWWLQNGERGISSETMFQTMHGVNLRGNRGLDHPHDPSDFYRCYKLLQAVPQWRESAHLNKMKKVSKQWKALVDNWDKLEQMLEEQLNTKKPNGMYEFMQSLIKN